MKQQFENGHESNLASATDRLLSLVNLIVSASTDPNAGEFDSATWLHSWVERPQAALGGRKPIDILDTATGLNVVIRLLGSALSGAYQ